MITEPNVKDFLEMYESLEREVNKAGGAGYSVKELSTMTVIELIQRLATNKIRFIYTGPKRPEED